MSDSSWDFLKIDYEQIKKAQNNSYGQKIAWNYQFMCWNNEQYATSKGETCLVPWYKFAVAIRREHDTKSLYIVGRFYGI